jgi:alpha-1,2-mannosyltransferase
MAGAFMRAAQALGVPGTGWLLARARVLLVLNLVLVGALVAIAARPGAGGERVWPDFVSFQAAGLLADAGTPEGAYDEAAHAVAERAALGPGRPYQYFLYPPNFLLLCAPLAVLPYPAAFLLLEGAGLLLFLLAMRGIAEARLRCWLVPVLAFPPLLWGVGLGQNALLTAALLAGATLSLDRRPVLAGLLFGALCYKPHLGLLVPVALAAGQRWRCFAAAAASAIGLCLLSWAVFGTACWETYLARFVGGAGAVYGSGQVNFEGMISPYGALRLLGVCNAAALGAQVAVALGCAAAVAWVWARRPDVALRSATLLAATLLAVPVVLFYDQLILLVALAWLTREWSVVGFRPLERLTLLLAYLVPLVSLPLALATGFPLAPLPAALVLLLCLRRAVERQGSVPDLAGALAAS